MFTQPLMYKKIKQQSPVMHSYAKKLIDSGIVSQHEFKVFANRLCLITRYFIGHFGELAVT